MRGSTNTTRPGHPPGTHAESTMKQEDEYATYLTKKGIADIKALEKEFNTTIIAYSTPPVPAKLTKAQLAKVKAVEEKHCVRLVAYTRGG
jgi:hypothetical protein